MKKTVIIAILILLISSVSAARDDTIEGHASEPVDEKGGLNTLYETDTAWTNVGWIYNGCNKITLSNNNPTVIDDGWWEDTVNNWWYVKMSCFGKYMTDFDDSNDEIAILMDIDSINTDTDKVECRLANTQGIGLASVKNAVWSLVNAPSSGQYNGFDYKRIQCKVLGEIESDTTYTFSIKSYIAAWDDTSLQNVLGTGNLYSNAPTYTYTGNLISVNDAPITEDLTIDVGFSNYVIDYSEFYFDDEEDCGTSTSCTPSEVFFMPSKLHIGKFYLTDVFEENEISSSGTLITEDDQIIFVPGIEFKSLDIGSIVNDVAEFVLKDSGEATSNIADLNLKKVYETFEGDLPTIAFKFNEDSPTSLEINKAELNVNQNLYTSLDINNDYCPSSSAIMEISNNNFNINKDYSTALTTAFSFNIPTNTFGEFNETITCTERDSSSIGVLTFNITGVEDPTTIYDVTVAAVENQDNIIELPIQDPDNQEVLPITISPNTNTGIILGAYQYNPSTNKYTINYNAPEIIDEAGTSAIKFDSFEITNNDDGVISSATVTIQISNLVSRPKPNSFSLNFNEDVRNNFYVSDNPDVTFFQLPANYDSIESRLSRVLITQKPVLGTLFYDSRPLPFYGQAGPYSLQDLRKLSYEPPANASGENYEIFRYKIFNEEGLVSLESADVIINILPENDPFNIISIDTYELPLSQSIVKRVDEDTTISIPVIVKDIDDDIIGYSISTNISQIIPDSEIKLVGTGNNKKIEIELPKDLSNITFSLNLNLFEYSDKEGRLIDNPYTRQAKYNIRIDNVNDVPTASNTTLQGFVYSDLRLEKSILSISDVDGNDQVQNMKIVELPSVGTLYNSPSDSIAFEYREDDKISAGDVVPIDNLIYNSDITNRSSSGIMKYQLFDGSDYSKIYQVNFSLIESPFGIYSQPATFGGIPIPNFEHGEWSCKPGYEPTQSSLSYGYTCTKIPNIPPVANFTIYPLFDGYAKEGVDLFFKSFSYDKDYSGIMELNWSFTNQTTQRAMISEFNGSICTNGICTVSLTVFDGEDYNKLTKTFNFTEGDVVDNSNYDFENLIIQKGKIYDENELSALGLQMGSTVTRGSEKITVDNSGKITKVEELQLYTSEGKESSNNKGFTPGDGYCDKFQSENSVNSPQDCKESSGLLGIIIVFSFISILGILGFVAWKKGLFNKLGSSKKSIAKPVTYDAPSYTAPANNSAVPTSNFLSKMIKEKIDQGYSEGEIKSYLISKGYSESEIDNAINS